MSLDIEVTSPVSDMAFFFLSVGVCVSLGDWFVLKRIYLIHRKGLILSGSLALLNLALVIV